MKADTDKTQKLRELCVKVLSSRDAIERVVSCGEKVDDVFLIYDPPYTLEVGRNRIVLKEGEEEVAVLTPEGVEYSKAEDLKLLEEWCVALTSLSFRRFIVKRKN